MRKGFTLVELAIVLVIIGIILGAVLKGKDLINNAKAKRTLNDLKGMEALALTFYDRYNRFPGDGNKDGYIDDAWQGRTLPNLDNNPQDQFLTNYTGDPDAPYAELERAQLISVTDHKTTARHPYNGGFFFISPTLTINGVTQRKNYILVEHIPCYAAKIIDTAIDNEINAQKGRVVEITSSNQASNQDNWNCSNESDLVKFVYELD